MSWSISKVLLAMCRSFYEFFFKYAVVGGRISPFRKRVALHVLPSVSAACANVSHDGHAMYARKNVVAYWRLVDFASWSLRLIRGWLVALHWTVQAFVRGLMLPCWIVLLEFKIWL